MNAGRMPMPRPSASWRGERSWLLAAPPDGSWGQTPQAPGSLLREQAALWEAHGSPAGLLLRDEALAEAERWASGHPEALTEAEGDFIRECREAARGAQRELARQGLLRGAITLAVIGLLLALCAWRAAQQRGADLSAAQAAAQARLAETAQAAVALQAESRALAEARDQAKERAAAMQRQLALERVHRLVAESRAALPEDRDLALLLAVEAAQRLPVDDWCLSQDCFFANADAISAALARALGHPRWRAWEQRPADAASAAPGLSTAWPSPDWRLLGARDGGGLAIWDGATGTHLADLQGEGSVSACAWSHDGSRVAVIGASRREVAAWNARTGERLWPAQSERGECTYLAWSPDDAQLLLACGSDLLLLDAATGSARAAWSRPAGLARDEIREAWWSLSGSQVTVLTESGEFSCQGGECQEAPASSQVIASSRRNALDGVSVWRDGEGLPMLRDLADLAAVACARAARNLSAAEWARYLGAEGPYRETCPGVAP